MIAMERRESDDVMTVMKQRAHARGGLRAFNVIRFVALIFGAALISPVTALAATDCDLWDRSFFSNQMTCRLCK